MTVEQHDLSKRLDQAQSVIEEQTSEIQRLQRSNGELRGMAKGAAAELVHRMAEGSDLNQVAAAISSVMEVQPLLEMIMEKSKELMDAEASSLMMLDEEEQELVFQVATGEKGQALREIRVPVGRGIAGWVAQTKQALLVPDAYKDPRFNPAISLATATVGRHRCPQKRPADRPPTSRLPKFEPGSSRL